MLVIVLLSGCDIVSALTIPTTIPSANSQSANQQSSRSPILRISTATTTDRIKDDLRRGLYPNTPYVLYSCTINLENNKNNCENKTFVQILETAPCQNPITDTPTGVDEAPELDACRESSALVKVSLGKNFASAVRYKIQTADSVGGWVANIGDSRTNDGWSNDYDTQTNDAELQLAYKGLTVYGSDRTAPAQATDGNRKVFDRPFDYSSSTITLTLSNELLEYDLGTADAVARGALRGAYLFALANQPDTQGVKNMDIFAAFNRVINGTYRQGFGAKRVTIEIITGGHYQYQNSTVLGKTALMTASLNERKVGKPYTTFRREVGRLETSQEVERIQELLAWLGYIDFTKINSIFDPETRLAIRKMQVDNGLMVTGSLHPDSRAFLNKYIKNN